MCKYYIYKLETVDLIRQIGPILTKKGKFQLFI